MKAEDIESALARGAWVSPPAPESPVGHVSADMLVTVEQAMVIARKNNLVSGGKVVCWNCFEAPALMPHLHCEKCYAHWKYKNGGAP